MQSGRATAHELRGATVLVTEPAGERSRQVALLEVAGAAVEHVPLIELVALDGAEHLARVERVIRVCEGFDWLLFTSRWGVDFFLQRLIEIRGGLDCLDRLRIACVGAATAERARARGLRVDLVPQRFIAEELVEALAAEGIDGRSFLLPRARKGRELIVGELQARGAAQVELLPIYENRAAVQSRAELMRVWSTGVDFTTFTSSSTVRAFVDMLGAACRSADAPSPPRRRFICIGPVTAGTASRLGLGPILIAKPYDRIGIVQAIAKEWSQLQGRP